MLLQSLGEILAPSHDEYDVLHQTITGLDVDDIARRATAEKLPAWQLASAAWAIVLTRHTFQSSLEFQATDVSPQSPSTPNAGGLCSFTNIQASVDEEAPFSELLHNGLGFSNHAEQLGSVATSSAVVVYLRSFSATTVEPPLPRGIRSDVTVQLLSKRPKTLQVICRYRRWLPAHYLQKLLGHFLHSTRHIINHRAWESLHLGDISMLSLQEEVQLRQDCLPTRSLADMDIGSVHQLFRRQAQRTPSSPALEGPGGDVISYRELDTISDLVAEVLRQRLSRVSPRPLATGLATDSGVVVGIMLQRSPAVVVAILSCWKAGSAIVLVDPSQPASRNGHIIQDCDCGLLLVDDSWKGQVGADIAWKFDFQAFRNRGFGVNNTPRYGVDEDRRAPGIDLSQHLFQPAWIRVTSGSTGRPKCALHSHAALGSSIASYAGRIRASKTLLFFNPISSAAGNAIWTFLTNGGCVCIPTQDEMTLDLAGCINRYGIEDICITPSALSLISPDRVPTLRTASLVGEATPSSVAETWSPHVSLLIGYGSTEMNSHALPFHDEPTGTLPPAHPLPTSDYSLYIFRPGTTDLCPLYVPGEICLSSTYMSSGYINRPEATLQVFQPHPYPNDAGHSYMYRTGDLGMFVAPRRFVLLGRVDFQFKVDGNRIQPEEVESIIDRIPHVVKSKVILVQPSTGRPVATCCVVLKEPLHNGHSNGLTNGYHERSDWGGFLSAAKQACSDHLPPYMMPHRWLSFSKFPETPTSKTDTKALAAEAKEILDSDAHELSSRWKTNGKKDQEPISGRARLFLDLALKTLAGQDISSLSLGECERMETLSFIANGGTSLLSLQLRSELRKQGVDIPLAKLYSSQSLMETAKTLASGKATPDEIVQETAGPVPTVTGALLPHLPSDLQPDLVDPEAIFPTTLLQREMFTMSMLNPKLWTFCQFLDLSQTDHTVAQIREAINLLVSSKRNLRTVFSLVGVPRNPTVIETPDSAFKLIRHGKFAQAVLNTNIFSVELAQEDSIEDPAEFWRKDVQKKWSFGRPLCRVAFLSKPRLLAWTFNHSIVDAWVAGNISQDLHAVLAAIRQRDSCQSGWQEAINLACERAAKPSIEQWVLGHYGAHGLDGGPPNPAVQAHTRVWETFMADVAVPTHIPDEPNLLPHESLPAPPITTTINSLPYGRWCRSHNTTPASLFHAVTALTIARLLNWWLPGGPAQPPEEVTYYRLSANRGEGTIQDASEMEGAVISISPMRTPVSASSDAATISRGALENWLATQESDPYYLDDQLMIATDSGGGAGRRRRWGNVLLNHMVGGGGNQEAAAGGASFRSVAQDKCGFAMVWPFATLEISVVEGDAKKADAVELCVMSVLEAESSERFVGVYGRILRMVVEGDGALSAMEIVRQL